MLDGEEVCIFLRNSDASIVSISPGKIDPYKASREDDYWVIYQKCYFNGFSAQLNQAIDAQYAFLKKMTASLSETRKAGVYMAITLDRQIHTKGILPKTDLVILKDDLGNKEFLMDNLNCLFDFIMEKRKNPQIKPEEMTREVAAVSVIGASKDQGTSENPHRPLVKKKRPLAFLNGETPQREAKKRTFQVYQDTGRENIPTPSFRSITLA